MLDANYEFVLKAILFVHNGKYCENPILEECFLYKDVKDGTE